MSKFGKAVLVHIRAISNLVLHTCFVSLVLSKVSNSLDWAWAAVFFPVFAHDGLTIIYYIIYLCGFCWAWAVDEDEDSTTPCFPGQKPRVMTLLFSGLGLLLKITAEVLLVVFLSGAGIPFYVCGIFLCLFFLLLTSSMFYYSIKPTVLLACRNC